MTNNLKLFIPISKIDEAKRIVYGTLTEEVADKTGEIFDYATGKEAFITWSNDAMERSHGKSKGNLRSMHAKIAAGKFTDIHYNDAEKRIEGAAKVTDDQEWAKVLDGTLTGFSIGGDYAARWVDTDNSDYMRYTPVLAEVSLVDNPCVASATFDVIKSDGSIEKRNFKTIKLETPNMDANLPQNSDDAKQVWMATDGSPHATKAAAMAKSAEVKATEKTQPLLDAVADLGTALKSKQDGLDGGDDDQGKAADGEMSDEEKEKAKAKAKKDKEDADAEKAAEDDADESARDKNKDTAPKKSFSGSLKKGLGAVSSMACAIENLNWLQDCIEYEALSEGDGSQVPVKLDVILKELCALLVELVQEETGELFPAAEMDKANKIAELAKRGARHSAKDMEMMAKAHDHATEIMKCMKAMGYGEEQAKDDADKAIMGELQALKGENSVLQKSIVDAASVLKSMQHQIEMIAAQPVQRKGVLKSVAKTDDVVGADQNQQTAPTDTLSLIKQAHSNPINRP